MHNFLLRYWKRTGNEEALDMVATTLIAMEKGGMNDQLGGGFHRYSVDEYWFVPHFEKMLYDQAQLVISYLEAFQITGNEAMERAARRTLDYVLRDMTSPEGAFWSAEDADSAPDPAKPHEKAKASSTSGRGAEVVELLGEEHARWFAFRYGMERAGNVRNDPHHEFTGLNILFQAHTHRRNRASFRPRTGRDRAVRCRAAENALFAARASASAAASRRQDSDLLERPDDLRIRKSRGRSSNEPLYADAARRAADFLLTTLRRADGTCCAVTAMAMPQSTGCSTTTPSLHRA